MNVKRLNRIFGYGLWIVGALKILLIILVLAKMNSNIKDIFSGIDLNGEYYPGFYQMLSNGIGISQLVLGIVSIIMIFVNTNNQHETITGYLIGIGALAVEFITPSIFSFYIVFVSAGMYMKAGNKITKVTSEYIPRQKTTKKMIKDTDWFYSDESKQIKNERVKKENYKSNLELSNEDVNETMSNEKIDGLLENANIGIILAVAIIVVLFIIGIFIYIIGSRTDNRTDNNIREIQVGVIEEKDVGDEKKETEDENYNTPVFEVEKDDNTKENDEILKEIKDIYNNKEAIQKMRSKGYFMNASVVENGLKVLAAYGSINFEVDFELNDNILYTEIFYNESNNETAYVQTVLAAQLIDCVGQMKGFPEQALAVALGKEQSLDFTIDNEGIESKKIEEEHKITIKVDLNSSFDFLNDV